MFSTLFFFSTIFFGVLIPPQLKKSVTIAIIGTNDIHGVAFPTKLFRADTQEKYNYGGLVYMARIIQILKNQFPNRILYLDAGDQFQGGIQSSKQISSGEILNDYYNVVGLDGSAIGNHQFDFGPTFLTPFYKGRPSPNLAANLRSETGDSNFLTNQLSSKIYILQQDIKIGVIGLSTIQTPTSTDAFATEKFPKYQFQAYKSNVITQSKLLRDNGANAVLILSHSGNRCQDSLDYGIWMKDSDQSICLDDQVTKMIDQLPQGTIDGVVQGHRHSTVHRFYKGIPIMGTINGGYYLNVMQMTFDTNKQLKNITIEGPIPVCEKIFLNTKRCNYLSSTQIASAGPLINWQFHNKDVYAHPQLSKIYAAKWQHKMQPYLVDLSSTQVTLRKQYNTQNDLGNLITNLIHQIVPDADFVILNAGGFRNIWYPGIIQQQHFFGMFPFINFVQTFQINGKQLLDTLLVVQSGAKSFYPTWGLKQRVKLFNNGTRKFLSAQWSNGKKIDNLETYKGVTISFILTGGDDFNKAINITYTPKNVQNIGEFRSIVRPKLVLNGIIKPNTLVDKKNPRLIIQSL